MYIIEKEVIGLCCLNFWLVEMERLFFDIMDYFFLLFFILFVLVVYNINIIDYYKFEFKVGLEKFNFFCLDSCLIFDWYDRCCICVGKLIWEFNWNISYDFVFVEYINMFG